METALLILLITVAGSSGFEIFKHCERARCETFTPADFGEVMRNFPPNEAELKAICPPLLETVDCLSDLVVECTGESLEELSSSENETVAELTRGIKNVMNLVKDVCDEKSQFRQDVIDSAACLKKMIAEGNQKCRRKSIDLYEMFRFPEGADEDDFTDDLLDNLVAEANCLTMVLEMGCFLKDVQETCGEVARDVLLGTVRRTKMLKMGICSERDLLTLRGSFLDFLEEQGEQRDFLSNAFEFRKRRK